MKITRTVRSTRTALAMTALLALAVLPATAAINTQDSASAAAGGSLVAGGTVAPAPAVADTGSSAAGDAGAATPQTASTDLDGAVASQAASTSAAQAAAASVPSDESGSTEARTVQRSCGAKADSHYVPSSGKDTNACYDKDGKFQSSRTYTATHYTNDVDCGRENRLYNEIVTGTAIYGNPGTDSGYVSACWDGSSGSFNPVEGRVTTRGDVDGSARVVWDGDKDNPEEPTQGWASATVSADGPEYRCGKPYAEGGRGTSDAPTSADNEAQCQP